jgi:imidazoleglycerol-phosphate dehydratase/histidinol-phosphatase
MDGAISGLQKLRDEGYGLVLATNQAYLGTPRNPQAMFDEVMKYFYSQLAGAGIEFEYSMICPHGTEDNCECRKPKIGGLTEFLAQHKDQIDLPNSLMFGERENDRQFAENLGVQFVPVVTNQQFVVPVLQSAYANTTHHSSALVPSPSLY